MKKETSGLAISILGPPLMIGKVVLEEITNQDNVIGQVADYLIKQAEKYVPQFLTQKANDYITSFKYPYGTLRTGNPLAGR